MYAKNELPIVRASICYYDSRYDARTAEEVLRVLKSYGFFPPDKLYAGPLTDEQYRPFDPDSEAIFVRAYGEMDVFSTDMANRDSREGRDFWRVDWGFTFNKASDRHAHPHQIKPWNILSLDSSYDRLQDPALHAAYIDCVKELIAVLQPFYASIDDVSVKATLLGLSKERRFTADRVQAIYWGNYWSRVFCERYPVEKLTASTPPCLSEPHADGLFFTLTPSVLNVRAPACRRARRHLTRVLLRESGLWTYTGKALWWRAVGRS